MDCLPSGHSVACSNYRTVRQIETGKPHVCLTHINRSGILLKSDTLLALHKRRRVAAAARLFIAGFSRYESRVDIIVLLLCHSTLGKQLSVAHILLICIFHLRTSLFYRSVVDRYVAFRSCNSRRRHAMSCLGVCKLRLRLRQMQAKLGILNHHQRVTSLDRLVFFKTNLTDETSHTGVDRSDVLAHRGIVGILDIAQMEKFIAHNNQSRQQ